MAHVRINLEKIPTSLIDYIKDDLERCLTKGSIYKPYNENTVLDDLNSNKEAIWSILVNYGLLTIKGRTHSSPLQELIVPNISAGFDIVKLLLLWKGRILSPDQASSDNYTVIPEDPIKLRQFHQQMMLETLKKMREESKQTPPIIPSSTSSHATVSSTLSATSSASAMTTQLSITSSAASTTSSSSSSHTAHMFSSSTTKSPTSKDESDKNFGSTLSGLRGAFSSRR